MSEVYRVAKIGATGHKKIAIFSDTHLSDRFDETQFKFIKQVIESVDQVIINGDFWDYYEATFDQFVRSPWKQLFPLLRKKQTIYVQGNHDEAELADERVALFSVQQVDECRVKAGQYQLKVRHGHQVVPSWDVKYPWLFKNRFMLRWGNLLQLVGVNLLGKNFLKIIFVYWNGVVKKQAQLLPQNEILVCGHTHLAEFNLDKSYINNGVIRWGLGQYLLINRGKLKLVHSYY